ncbi:hypothetical protein FRC01_002957, partial [Tulasnella sp. 417]
WHHRVRTVGKLSIQTDVPADPESELRLGKDVEATRPKIIFAFGPKPDTYCMTHPDRTKFGACPSKLSTLLREPGSPSAVSIGEGGAFFWRKDTGSIVSKETEMVYPEVWKIWNRNEVINWVVFGPEGYYIIETPQDIYASRQNEILRVSKADSKPVPIRCASFGWGGCWVIIEADGTVRSHRLKMNVRKALLRGSVRYVSLSWTDPNQFYIEYMDKTSDWSLPGSWHQIVSDIEGNLPKPPTTIERLEKVKAGSPEFNAAEYQFNMSWRQTDDKRPAIRHIYRIILLAGIWNRYVQYR